MLSQGGLGTPDADTGKPDGARREAETVRKSSPRRQQSGGKIFPMENAHWATAGTLAFYSSTVRNHNVL